MFILQLEWGASLYSFNKMSRLRFYGNKTALKSTQKELTKLEAKKAAADQKAAEVAKKNEAENLVKKLLAEGVSDMHIS